MFRQAVKAARIAHLTDDAILSVLRTIGKQLSHTDFTATPPENSMIVYDTIRAIAKVDDVYQELKNTCTDAMLSQYAAFKRDIETASDPLLRALQYAALGNAIDPGANPDFSLNAILDTVHKPFARSDYRTFQTQLDHTDNILIIADNAGETVLDRLLIEQLNRRVTYAVRSRPIINDATVYDAQRAGIEKVAKIIESGCFLPGTVLARCSPQFMSVFESADLIMSKGQGNYETLSLEHRPMFFLLNVKCAVVAEEIGARVGDIVLIQNQA
jgi:uncharacterized protein with ATP-grasp and redox domains